MKGIAFNLCVHMYYIHLYTHTHTQRHTHTHTKTHTHTHKDTHTHTHTKTHTHAHTHTHTHTHAHTHTHTHTHTQLYICICIYRDGCISGICIYSIHIRDGCISGQKYIHKEMQRTFITLSVITVSSIVSCYRSCTYCIIKYTAQKEKRNSNLELRIYVHSIGSFSYRIRLHL